MISVTVVACALVVATPEGMNFDELIVAKLGRGRRCRLNTINTLKAHRSAGGNKDAVWSGLAAFAYQADQDLAGRMRPFARTLGILRDDAMADCDAFITNESRRAGDELSHSALRSVAERATILPPLEEEQQ